jgi:two-component system OmpR family response regulator
MTQTSSESLAVSAAPSTATNILVVDDDVQILELVARFLRSNGFFVQTARDGREMQSVLAERGADLIVLDLMLPGTTGLELCRELRKTSSVPVVMLTAKGEEIDRIIGLEVGADDYLPKPFNPRELLARVNAVLRRTAPSQLQPGRRPRALGFAGWKLDILKRELTNPAGIVVDLSTGEYDLLITFLEAPQRVLSRDYLLDAARNRTLEPFDRAIDVQVSRLRRKIGDGGELIKTVRGAGYLFAADVDRLG